MALSRADTFSFGHELTEEEKPVFALPFQGYSGPTTMTIEDADGRDRRRHLPPLSLKTARHAVGYLPDQPVALLTETTADPLAAAILEALERRGLDYVRRQYFSA